MLYGRVLVFHQFLRGRSPTTHFYMGAAIRWHTQNDANMPSRCSFPHHVLWQRHSRQLLQFLCAILVCHPQMHEVCTCLVLESSMNVLTFTCGLCPSIFHVYFLGLGPPCIVPSLAPTCFGALYTYLVIFNYSIDI